MTVDHADVDAAVEVERGNHDRRLVVDGNSSGVKPLRSGDSPSEAQALFDETGPLPAGRSPRTGSPVASKRRAYEPAGPDSPSVTGDVPHATDHDAEATVADWNVPTAEVRPEPGSDLGVLGDYVRPPTADKPVDFGRAGDRMAVDGYVAPRSDSGHGVGMSAHGVPQATVLDQPPPPVIGEPVPVAPPKPGVVTQERLQRGSGFNAGDLAARMPQFLEPGLLKRSQRVRARKTRRVVRHIDPWSVLTFSVLFFLCLYAALLLSSVLVWNAAVAAGTLEKIESFVRELGDYETYEIKGDVVFRAAMVIAGILTLASSVLMVLLTVVFNLISDLVGGIRMTVVEEETVRVRRRSEA
ncbi:MAG: DUF3566 domain-containing protein [Acidimicrobiales bacterium]